MGNWLGAQLPPKGCPSGEKQGYFWRETQLLPSGPKAKGYSTLILAFLHGPPKCFIGTLTYLLYTPFHGGHEVAKENESRFAAPEWLWSKVL